MVQREKQEACQLYIEQEIDKGLSEGKTPYTVAKEIIPWLQKLFDVKAKAKTIEKRAERRREELPTNVGNVISNCNDTILDNLEKLEKPKPEINAFSHGGARVGSGRPPVFRLEEPAHRTSFTGENEWYTPIEYIESARQAMGSIDFDPASSDFAQKRIKAGKFCTATNSGLACKWGGNVWLNPPYAQPLIQNFIEKAVSEWLAGRINQMIILTHNYTDTAWFHMAEAEALFICFTRGRVKFEKDDGTIASPTQGSAFFYYGNDEGKFKNIFSQYGFIR